MSINSYPRVTVQGTGPVNNPQNGQSLMVLNPSTGKYEAATTATFSGGGGGGDATANNQNTQIDIANEQLDFASDTFLQAQDSNNKSVFKNTDNLSAFLRQVNDNATESVFLTATAKSAFLDAFDRTPFLDLISGLSTFIDAVSGKSAFIDQTNNKSAFIDQTNNKSALVSQMANGVSYLKHSYQKVFKTGITESTVISISLPEYCYKIKFLTDATVIELTNSIEVNVINNYFQMIENSPGDLKVNANSEFSVLQNDLKFTNIILANIQNVSFIAYCYNPNTI
jgi:hypothetical protein